MTRLDRVKTLGPQSYNFLYFYGESFQVHFTATQCVLLHSNREINGDY